MSPKVPEAYLEARRIEILEAAGKCFVEKGYHNATMQDIYKATNLSPGAVYNYFSSKEDIVVAAIKEFTDWSTSYLASLITENPDESLIKVMRLWLSSIIHNYLDENISVQLEFYSEAIRDSNIRAAILKSQEATHDQLIELIKKNQRSGMINSQLDPLSIARAVMGIMFGIMIHKSLEPELDLNAFEQVCEALFTGTFSSRPTKRRNTNHPQSHHRSVKK